MKRKQRRKREPKPLLQLCLFDEQTMQAMADPEPKQKTAVQLPVDPDPAWLQWQLIIWEGLRGYAWRQQRAMLLAGKKEKTRRVQVVPGHYLVKNELLI